MVVGELLLGPIYVVRTAKVESLENKVLFPVL